MTSLVQFDQFYLEFGRGEAYGQTFVMSVVGPANDFCAIDIWRMSESGPHSQFSSTRITLDSVGRWQFPMHSPLPDGLYLASLTKNPTSLQLPLKVGPDLMPFNIINGLSVAPEFPQRVLDQAIHAQNSFLEREFRHENFSGNNRLTVTAIIDGCFLDYHQKFEGGYLQPLNQKYGPESLLEVVNSLVINGPPFYADVIREAYSQSHPLCLAVFVNVQAARISEAVDALSVPLERVLCAIAEDRAAMPSVIAYISEDRVGNYQMTFPVKTYPGNLLKGIGPGVTRLLDDITVAVRDNPWIDFALRQMRLIRLQENPDVQLFQSWTLIEAAAKRAVVSDDKIFIKDKNGDNILYRNKPLRQDKDIGRVIVYLRDIVGADSLPLQMLEGRPDLYTAIFALYTARNRIAHEGSLSIAGLPSLQFPDWQLVHVAKQCASDVLRFEIRQIAYPNARAP